MKHVSRSHLFLGCFGLLSVAFASTAHAQYKCDQRHLTRVDAHACALGAKDVAALRRYVTMTQAIHSLQMKDYVRFVGDEPTSTPARPAQVKPQNSVAGVAPPSR